MAPIKIKKKTISGAMAGNTKTKTDTKSASTKTKAKEHCYFLDLPTELRLSIYGMHFASVQERTTQKSIQNQYLADEPTNEITFFTALLYTNKQIFGEAYSLCGKHGDFLTMELQSINEDIQCMEMENDVDDEYYDDESDPGREWARYVEDKFILASVGAMLRMSGRKSWV